MPLTHQQRQWAILGGVFGGGVLIAVLIVSLFNGDDSKRAVDVQPNQPSSSTTLLTTTSTLAPVTLPPTTLITAPPTTGATTPATITPGTTVIIPPTTKPTVATTTTPTEPSTTSSTSKPPTVSQELDAALEDALLGGEPPADPDAPGRVRTVVRGNIVRVTWALDETLLPEDLPVAAREEATALLRAIQGFATLEDQQILLRATLPDPDTGKPQRVVRLVFERATLDAIDFDTVDPLTIFELADEADINPILDLPVDETTTSSSSP